MTTNLLNDVIYVYTDGGIKGNGSAFSIGAWAYILYYNGEEKEGYMAQRDTTNNIEEISGIINGLKSLKRHDLPVIVVSDSQYCVRGMNEWLSGWKKKGWRTSTGDTVKNKELWKELDDVSSSFSNITYQWVKGHGADEYNERCDKLCHNAILEFESKMA